MTDRIVFLAALVAVVVAMVVFATCMPCGAPPRATVPLEAGLGDGDAALHVDAEVVDAAPLEGDAHAARATTATPEAGATTSKDAAAPLCLPPGRPFRAVVTVTPVPSC